MSGDIGRWRPAQKVYPRPPDVIDESAAPGARRLEAMAVEDKAAARDSLYEALMALNDNKPIIRRLELLLT